MRTFAILFVVGLTFAPWMQAKPDGTIYESPVFYQAKPDVPAQKVAPTPTPTPVSEPLPELMATKIALIQSEYEKAGLILKATPAYQAWEAKTNDLGKQMTGLLEPYQKDHACVVDQIAKTCVKPAKVEK